MSTSQAILEQMRKALLLQRDGNPARARSLYERILKQDPANAEATNLLALCFLELGYPKRSVSLLTRALALKPGEPRYHANLAEAHKRLGDPAAALAAVEAGLRSAADASDLLAARVGLLDELGRPEDALAACDAALRANPDDTDLLAGYGRLLLLLSRHDQAEKVFRFLLAAEPGHRIALLGLADALNQLDRPQEALDLLRSSADVFDPETDAEYRLHLANAHWGCGGFSQALEDIDAAQRLGCRTADSYLLRGKSLFHLGRFAEARADLERALAIAPARADIATTLGFCCLSLGDLERGWPLVEYRFDMRARGVIRRRLAAPSWRGEPLDGKTLMVWDDQGIGDVLRNASLFAEMRARCGHLILECHPKLVPILSRNFPDMAVRVRSHDGATRLLGGEDFDVQCSVGALPMHLRRSLGDFPATAGFLAADPDRIAELRRRAPLDGPGPVVGLSWTSGNRTGLRARSYLDLDDLLPLFEIPDVAFVLLDYTDRSAEIAALEARHGHRLHRWDDLDLFDDLETVAALTAAMDLVISANTSVADMSGALGVPTWRFGPVTGVTLLGAENPPWYPDTRYFRLAPEAPAREVVPRLAAELAAWRDDRLRGYPDRQPDRRPA